MGQFVWEDIQVPEGRGLGSGERRVLQVWVVPLTRICPVAAYISIMELQQPWFLFNKLASPSLIRVHCERGRSQAGNDASSPLRVMPTFATTQLRTSFEDYIGI